MTHDNKHGTADSKKGFAGQWHAHEYTEENCQQQQNKR